MPDAAATHRPPRLEEATIAVFQGKASVALLHLGTLLGGHAMTLVARDPTRPDGDNDLVVSDDRDPAALLAALSSMMGKSEMAP